MRAIAELERVVDVLQADDGCAPDAVMLDDLRALRRQIDRLPEIDWWIDTGCSSGLRHTLAIGIQYTGSQLRWNLRNMAADVQEHLTVGATRGSIWRRDGGPRQPRIARGTALLRRYPLPCPGV